MVPKQIPNRRRVVNCYVGLGVFFLIVCLYLRNEDATQALIFLPFLFFLKGYSFTQKADCPFCSAPLEKDAPYCYQCERNLYAFDPTTHTFISDKREAINPKTPQLAKLEVKRFGIKVRTWENFRDFFLVYFFLLSATFGIVVKYAYFSQQTAQLKANLRLAIQEGQLEEVKRLYPHFKSGRFEALLCSPLYEAVSFEQLELVQYFLEQDLDPNAKCYAPNEVIRYNQATSFATAKKQTQDIKSETFLENSRTFYPLIAASTIGKLEIVQALLNAKANINIQDRLGNTPLMVALQNAHIHIVELLVSQGASLHLMDKQGKTALHQALDRGYIDLSLYLIQHGADLNALDLSGQTPLTLIQKLNLGDFFQKVGQNQLPSQFPQPVPSISEPKSIFSISKNPGHVQSK